MKGLGTILFVLWIIAQGVSGMKKKAKATGPSMQARKKRGEVDLLELTVPRDEDPELGPVNRQYGQDAVDEEQGQDNIEFQDAVQLLQQRMQAAMSRREIRSEDPAETPGAGAMAEGAIPETQVRAGAKGLGRLGEQETVSRIQKREYALARRTAAKEVRRSQRRHLGLQSWISTFSSSTDPTFASADPLPARDPRDGQKKTSEKKHDRRVVSRPVPAVQAHDARGNRLHRIMTSSCLGIRDLFLFSELLKPPVSMRKPGEFHAESLDR